MESSVLPSTESLAQNTHSAISMLNGQQGFKANDTTPSDGSFAELLKSSSVDPADAKQNGNDQRNFSSKGTGHGGLTVSSLASPGDSSGESTGSATPNKEPSKDELQEEVNYSGLASLILSMVQVDSKVTSASKSGDTGIDSSETPLAKVEQQLITLLTASQTSRNENSSTTNELNSPVTGSPSPDSNSGNDFMSMLSRKAIESAATKGNLLKVLTEASNSSVNRGFSDEVEEILSGLSESNSQSKTNLEIGLLQKSAKNAMQDSNSPQVEGKNQPDMVPQGLASERGTLQSANDGKSSGKSSTSVAMSQSAGNISVENDDNPAGYNNQSVTGTGNASQSSDKTVGNASSTTDKQGSAKSDNGLPSLLKQDGTGAYQLISMGSKADSRFKDEFSSATDSSHDADSSNPDVSQVAQSIIREAKMMTQENKTVVNVKLEPESLGSVILRVSSDNGKISAEFNVKTADAHAYLESSIPQMKQMLESNGVSLSHLSVNLSGGDSQTKQQQNPARKNSQKFSMDKFSDSTDAARNFGYNTMEVKV